jgi:hypothetical protein
MRAEEHARVARGEARAVDLAQAQAWEVAEAAAMSALGRRAAEAHAGTLAARAAEDGARTALAGRKADRDVVAKDEAKFARARVRAAEAREDEEAADVFGGRAPARERSR